MVLSVAGDSCLNSWGFFLKLIDGEISQEDKDYWTKKLKDYDSLKLVNEVGFPAKDIASAVIRQQDPAHIQKGKWESVEIKVSLMSFKGKSFLAGKLPEDGFGVARVWPEPSYSQEAEKCW